MLTARDPSVRGNIVVGRAQYLQDLAPLLPTFIGFHWPYRGLLRKEMKRVLHLTTLYRLLDDLRSVHDGTVILDEGPVYMLSRMWFFAEGRIDNHGFERWWHGAIRRWTGTIQAIVWLDADNGILAHRIRQRGEPYPSVFGSLPDTPDRPLFQFLSRYRGIYQRVIAEMTRGGVPVIRFDTGVTPTKDIADQVLHALRNGASSRRNGGCHAGGLGQPTPGDERTHAGA